MSFTSADLLYVTLSIAAITLTVVLVMLGVQLSQILGEVRRAAASVERMTSMLEGISGVLLKGVEREAQRVDGMGRKLGSYLEKSLDTLVNTKK